jgi:hypothetical protein
MQRKKQGFYWGFFVTCLALSMLGLASVLFDWTVWDGGFPQAQFHIYVVGESDRPLEDVEIEIRDRFGNKSYCYPVTDYHLDNKLVTDADGKVVFHHVNLSPEFGGQCLNLFFVIPIGKCEAPR